MNITTTMLNDITIVYDEEEKCLKTVVKFQALLKLDDFQKLIDQLKNKEDGTFKTTIE